MVAGCKAMTPRWQSHVSSTRLTMLSSAKHQFPSGVSTISFICYRSNIWQCLNFFTSQNLFEIHELCVVLGDPQGAIVAVAWCLSPTHRWALLHGTSSLGSALDLMEEITTGWMLLKPWFHNGISTTYSIAQLVEFTKFLKHQQYCNHRNP